MNLEDLLAEREITRAIIRFARAMDARDWAAFDELVADDATSDMGTGPLTGRVEIVALMRSYLDRCGTTQHLIGNVLVDVDGDTATSRAYVCDRHLAPGDAPDLPFSSLGDYEDTWRRDGDRWRMVRRVKHNRASVGSMSVFGDIGD